MIELDEEHPDFEEKLKEALSQIGKDVRKKLFDSNLPLVTWKNGKLIFNNIILSDGELIISNDTKTNKTIN